MAFSLFGKGLLRSRIGGIRLPSFDIDDGSGTKLLQWLFGSGKAIDVVKDDGFTYIKDKANKGTDRLQLQGVKNIFDGVDGKITIPHSDSLTFGNGTVDQPFSVTYHITNIGAGAEMIYTKGEYNVDGISVLTTGSDDFYFRLVSSAGNTLAKNLLNTGTGTSDNFVICTYDGSGNEVGLKLFIYVGGSLIGTGSTNSAGVYTALPLSTDNSVIGADITNGEYASSDIWDVRVHNSVLTQAQIDLLVANPNTLLGTEVGKWNLDEGAGLTAFDSVGGNHGTISGGVTWGTQDVVSFQNYSGYIESDGVSYYENDDATGLIPIGVKIPKLG